ncbi:MAG: dethiobiotin synthase [Deltaproteobacteria bacterium]|nr:dethiobiotin synthase [Deltaproteobacteria bacterium]
MKSLFITATDTNVGKTLVGAAIAAFLRSKKINVGVFKPCESGCSKNERGELIPADALFLKQMSASSDSLEEINPYRFAAPLAPGLAAQLENKEIDLEKIKRQFLEIEARHEITLVEGAGGLMVPLGKAQNNVHLIQKLEIPVLLIVRNGLGTLNHTLLSLAHLEREKVEVLGLILNQTQAEVDTSAVYNLETLREWTSVPVLGVFPFIQKPFRVSVLAEEAKKILLEHSFWS